MSKLTAIAPARSPYRYQYAAKFICVADIPGTSQQAPGLRPGTYETSVNIHNPQDRTVRYRSKLAYPNGISKWLDGSLKYDEVDQIACGQVDKYELQLIHGFEGYLVIESTHSLDVIAVYTASPNNQQVSTMDVERVAERRLIPREQD